MPDLLIITPSRQRPRRLEAMARAVRATTHGRADIIAMIDEDDPDLDAYAASDLYQVAVGPRGTLSALTNLAALGSVHKYRYLASLGDDHVPKTGNWDRMLIDQIEALDGPGWAYGDDGFQGPNLPTAWVQSSALADALGWMMLPACEHMYVDNAVLELGRRSGRIIYHPDVLIDHQHPLAGHASLDESYRRSNAPAQFERDKAAFDVWAAGPVDRDVELVRSLRHV